MCGCSWIHEVQLGTDGTLVLLKDFSLIMGDMSGKKICRSAGDYGLIWKTKSLLD